MGFYQKHIVPRFTAFVMGAKPITKQREKVVPLAEGRILEIGMGAGHNLPFYDPSKVEKVWGLEPDPGIRKYAMPKAEAVPFDVEFLDLPGEEIPLEDKSVDTVLTTFTMCSIPGVHDALLGMRRVLKPGGRMIFCEHGTAPDEGVRKWQDRVNPIWRGISGGCNVNRNIPKLIDDAGFKVENMENMYLPGTPKFAGYNFWGSATAR